MVHISAAFLIAVTLFASPATLAFVRTSESSFVCSYGHCLKREHIEARDPIVLHRHGWHSTMERREFWDLALKARERKMMAREGLDAGRELEARSPIVIPGGGGDGIIHTPTFTNRRLMILREPIYDEELD